MDQCRSRRGHTLIPLLLDLNLLREILVLLPNDLSTLGVIKHEVASVTQLALHGHQHHSTLALIYSSFHLIVICLLKYLILKIRVLRKLEQKLET